MGIGLVYEAIVMKMTDWHVRTLAQYVTLVLVAAATVHLVAIRRLPNRLLAADAVIPAWILSQRLGAHILVWQSSSHTFFQPFLELISVSLTCKTEIARWAGVCAIITVAVYTGLGLLVGPALLWVLVLERTPNGWTNNSRTHFSRHLSAMPTSCGTITANQHNDWVETGSRV